MKFFVIIVLYSSLLYSKEVQYLGTVAIKNKTNIPEVTVVSSTNKFQKFSTVFSEDMNSLSRIEIVVNTSSLETAVYLKNHHLYQQDFSFFTKSKSPVFFKMLMEKIQCSKKNINLNCSGIAEFMIGKLGFTRKLEFTLDKNRNTSLSFTISKKELALKSPQFLGIELEDNVLVSLTTRKK